MTTRRATTIEHRGGWQPADLSELWAHRELVLILAWRDVQVRYRQTAIGVAWVVLQPLAAMAIFSVVFGRLAGMPSDRLPYPLFALAGLAPWLYFANAVGGASGSLVANSALISKVYFPRLAIPLASVLAGLVDLLITTGALLVAMMFFGVLPGPGALLLPALAALAAVAALSVSVWLSALDVQYRDVRYAIPFLLQIWLFATPVVYPSSLVPETWRALVGLNPMASIVELFRWAATGAPAPSPGMLATSAAVTLVLLVTGVYYFRRAERTFADVI